MTAPKPASLGNRGRVRKARKTSTCPVCHGPVTIGQLIAQVRRDWVHATCLIAQRAEWKRTAAQTVAEATSAVTR